MINGNSCRRECKLVKLFLQEFFEEVLRSDADCHVGVKFGSAVSWHVMCHVVDRWFIDIRIFLCCDERSGRSRFDGERCDCINQFLLKSPEIVSRPGLSQPLRILCPGRPFSRTAAALRCAADEFRPRRTPWESSGGAARWR